MLREQNYFVQRIESGTTSRGIPDIYLGTPLGDTWLELKNNPKHNWNFAPDAGVTVPWRPGQQAWALRYYQVRRKCVYTLYAFNDVIVAIPMWRVYRKNWVPPRQFGVYNSVHDLVKDVDNLIGGKV
jgi:hypothetical protein